MMEWMDLFVKDSLALPSLVCLVPAKNLNPESYYYYQYYKQGSLKDVWKVAMNEISKKE